MTPQQIIRQLDALAKKLLTAKKRALSSTRRALVPAVKRDIIAVLPRLKQGLAKGFNIRTPITTNGDITSAIVKILPNQPNARRFITPPNKGTWRRLKIGGSVPGRPTTNTGGLFVRTPQNTSIFIRGAFIRSINGGPKIVWRLDGNGKMKAVRGYSSLAFFKANNQTAPGFYEAKWQRQGTELLMVEYTRQLGLIQL